ncbi:uncharacterized protein Z519_03701 [Cladophialophora bantiana CBS 173.52]|uniref:HIG1 domain-containing protein n=1 Tax=Cladophialophora bantiana (strain ATCC 10958 / CBS 173.52 / CDC B-1940 / NIH 8579) TaxID=1442370 RepID=A0A0D2G946_CLAB1|nr:uncharacterized protein Z519_03701 [Cladophialophora bantiana CBS 173.52]KIW95117.1 hypothetical protein Z519_03701 [Cladophialophora bantiana CBS 173.52]
MARAVKPRGSVWNPRTVTAPIAAVVMAGLLYTYAITSIRAAKRNAKLHREADGGQLDMRRESLRRHGLMEPVQGTSGYELFRDARADAKQESKFMGEKKAKPMGAEQKEESGTPRTENEGVLETYRGSAGMHKLKEGRPRE